MFVYSVRASAVKLFGVIALTLAVLAIIVFGGNTVFASAASDGEIDFSGIRAEEDRIAFLESLGIKVKAAAPVEKSSFVMPENFDRVLLGYNEIQKSQGLDLSKYAKKRVTRYTYEVEGYEGHEGTVYANLIIYRSRIIGCDISSADPNGFVEPVVI